MDNVRRREAPRPDGAQGDDTLTGSKYVWRYGRGECAGPASGAVRPADGGGRQALKTTRAWALKESLRDLWQYTRSRVGLSAMEAGGTAGRPRPRLTPVIEIARMIKRHLPNVLTYFRPPHHERRQRGAQPKIQTIKKMAYGFRNREHFKTAIYFHCGGLDLYPATHGEAG